MTFEPSRQIDLFQILGISQASLSGAPPARTSPAPTPRARASKASAAASISKPFASSEKSALVGSLLKIALISELEAQTACSLRWRQSATPAGRSWCVLAMGEAEQASEPTMNGRGPGSSDATLTRLPTPMASDGMRDGKGGGAGSTYPFRMILSTPRASDMKAGGHGDAGRMGSVRHQINQAMLATPTASDAHRGGKMINPKDGPRGYHLREEIAMGEAVMSGRFVPHSVARMMPTPLAGDRKGSLGVMSNGIVKGQNIPTALRDSKWDGARRIAEMLRNHGLTGTAALPVTYGWMMGFPPGWLARALQWAVQEGHLQQVSLSKRSATRSSRKSRKQ
jgi:hypothetical protein